MQKMKNRIVTALVMIICLIISYSGHYYFQRIAKDLEEFEKSECSGSEWVTVDRAFADFSRPRDYQLGEMNCYCN
jgi:hypothetical protein